MTAGEDVGRLSGLRQHVPGLRVIHAYRRSWVRPDLVAGLVLAAILVPQGMAYAELAGLPAVTGLYTTIACLVGYAVMGPSRILVLGPDSSVSPLIFAAIMPMIAVSGDPGSAIVLAGMMALLVGAVEIGLGVAKLGFVADLLSVEVQVGYMNGLGITIIVGQLPKLFGFSTDADGFVDELRAFGSSIDETQGTTLAVGLSVLVLLLVLPRISRRVPAILVAIVCATVVSAVLDLSAEGVATVAPTTATRTAGMRRVILGSTSRTARVARPISRAVLLIWSRLVKNSRTSSTKLSASVEKPHSFGSCPTMIVMARPFM